MKKLKKLQKRKRRHNQKLTLRLTNSTQLAQSPRLLSARLTSTLNRMAQCLNLHELATTQRHLKHPRNAQQRDPTKVMFQQQLSRKISQRKLVMRSVRKTFERKLYFAKLV